ncbi:MAG TPA: hypothetical protein ENO25_03015 [Desulfobacteraceae bacterium]|nr:hypothetical protein [Desulfobacteraceae bacterium]
MKEDTQHAPRHRLSAEKWHSLEAEAVYKELQGGPEGLEDGEPPGADGLMRRGLMIRHLVMPNSVGGTKDVLEWIAGILPKETYVNIMSQYRPMYKASAYPEIARRITREEYEEAMTWAREYGLANLEIQGYGL